MNYEEVVLALCLWREARGDGEPGMRAVYHVILNRVADKRWPDQPLLVALQRKQFSCFNRMEPQDWPVPRDNDPEWDAFRTAMLIIGNAPGDDPTSGANHYFAPSAVSARPKWAEGKAAVAIIGRHWFFRI